VLNWSGGLPFTVTYNEAGTNVPGSAPSYPSAASGKRMPTSLTGPQYDPVKGTLTRNFFKAQTTNLITDPGTGVFVNPGLDNIGNVGYNTYRGPGFFNEDIGLVKAFTIRGGIVTKFRMDAFNAFNHINPGQPSGGIEGKVVGDPAGAITGQGPGGQARYLEFSLRVQF
jgi:hypothetical protein